MVRWLGIIPFIAMVLAAPLVNRVEPRIFGMPFFLGWLVIWTVLSSVLLFIVYVVERRQRRGG
jgi:polyferredoxin